MTTEIAETVTAADAQATGLVPAGHVWDEELQLAIPRGQAITHANLDKPIDLKRNLETYARTRQMVLRFMADQLVEAEYDEKGWPVPGKLGDYYTLPTYDKKQLTKIGAEKIGSLFRFFAGPVELVSQTKERDYCDATVSMTLLDQYHRVVGSAISACSTAESGFQGLGSKRKYGGYYVKENGKWVAKIPPDFRAALNDVTARARKRCFVQAIILATCTDEILEAGSEDEPEREGTKVGDLPTKMTIGKLKGTKLVDITTETLFRCATWCRDKGKHERLADACDLIVDQRRDSEEDTGDAPY